MSRRTKQDLIARRLAGCGVRGEISLAEIDLHFDNPAGGSLRPGTAGQCPNENFSQQLSCYDAWITRIKALWKDAFASSRHLRLRLPAATTPEIY
jgi:hypothetical protein